MEPAPFSRRPEELSCIIGNLFTALEPPCDECGQPGQDGITLTGTTHSGKTGKLVITGDRCVFYGDPEDLALVLSGRCPGRRTPHG